MDDITIRMLLSRFIRQALRASEVQATTSPQEECAEATPHTTETTDTSDKDDFADWLALAAWNSLIYLLRQSFAKNDEVSLEEVGSFVKIDQNVWSFYPAASLREADALKLPATEGHRRLAQSALFHLNQGASLAEILPHDIEVARNRLLDFVEVHPEIFNVTGTPPSKPTLSVELRNMMARLDRIAERLSPSSRTAGVGGLSIEATPSTAVSTHEEYLTPLPPKVELE